MLRVTLHAGGPGEVSAANRLGWLDISYSKLAAMATYRAVLFAQRVGALAPVDIQDYPRWSASVFDLVARALALSLYRVESIPQDDAAGGRAYAETLTVRIEHSGLAGPQRRKWLGELVIERTGRRGNYEAVFDEDILGRSATARFTHRPQVLTPWDLVLRAIAHRLTGASRLPPRPALIWPPGIEKNGRSYLSLVHLEEPARTGYLRWLEEQGLHPADDPQEPAAMSPRDWYLRFLNTAV
ncbi:hypothetical protein FBR04_09950 [Betaproteobacteria bacterium PRO7]|jgi:hypothetical protein|nr:hypothetical protein [Betaproteobacteria bacterium PRO7]